MKFIVALLIASTQAITLRYDIYGNEKPWNPPAQEPA